MADCELFGFNAGAHHLSSLIYHAIDSILLLLVLMRMTRRLWPSALVAALFAVHPLHVESVAWVSERKDLVSTLFWIAALGAYTWYTQRPNPVRYLAVAFMFFLGLMSKPMVVTLPFVLLLLDYWPLDRLDRAAPFGELARRASWLAAEKIPLFLMTGLYCLLVVITEAHGNNLLSVEEAPLLVRCANAVVVYVLYLVKTAWPSGLACFYPFPNARPLWQVAGAGVILVAISLVCFRQARRRPYLIVGWLWYLGTLVPVIGLVLAGNFSHADRFTYIPLIGIFAIVAWGMADMADAWRIPRRAVAAAACLMLGVLGVCANIQTSYWRDTGTLFRHAIAVGQESSLACSNLGSFALSQGRPDEAIVWLTKSTDLDPQNVNALNDLGLIALYQGRYADARAYLDRALAVDPQCFNVISNLGVLALTQKDYVPARAYLTKALELKPESFGILCNLGLCLMHQGQYEEAQQLLRKAFEMDPQSFAYLNELGDTLVKLGRKDEADIYFRKAAELNQPRAVGK